MSRWLIACQQLYNAALEQRRDAYRKSRTAISLYNQQKQLTELRTDPEWRVVPAEILRSPLTHLDKAFQAFFRSASWRMFLQCLTNKAEEAGTWVIGVNPRTHSCSFCGLTLDRDHNAAINIKALGLSALEDIAYV